MSGQTAKRVYFGNPVNPNHQPDPQEIVDFLEGIVASARAAANIVQTEADLLAITPVSENDGGRVLDDPDSTKNGDYYRASAAWVQGRGFPDTFAEMALSGTSGAQTATLAAGVDPAGVVVYFAKVDVIGDAAMTLAITGLNGSVGLPVKNIAGNDVAEGDWTSHVLVIDKLTYYQMITSPGGDIASAASAALSFEYKEASEAAAELAGEANSVSGVQVEKAGNYTIVEGDLGKTVVHTSATSHSFGFAAAATLGTSFLAIIKNEGVGDLALSPNGSETLDGESDLVLSTGQSTLIFSDGSNLRTALKSASSGAALARNQTHYTTPQLYSSASDHNISGMDTTIIKQFDDTNVKITWNVMFEVDTSGIAFYIKRDGTEIGSAPTVESRTIGIAPVPYDGDNASTPGLISIDYIDEDSVAAGSHTYSIHVRGDTAQLAINRSISDADDSTCERGTSRCIVEELPVAA